MCLAARTAYRQDLTKSLPECRFARSNPGDTSCVVQRFIEGDSNMRKFLIAAVAVFALAATAPAFAADPTTFGGTATITNGVATLVVEHVRANTPADDFGGVTFPLPAGLTLAQITQLSAEFNVTDDDCGGGSPRFADQLRHEQERVRLPRPVAVRSRAAAETRGSRPATWSALPTVPRRHGAALARHAVLHLGGGARAARHAGDQLHQLRRRRRLVAQPTRSRLCSSGT